MRRADNQLRRKLRLMEEIEANYGSGGKNNRLKKSLSKEESKKKLDYKERAKSGLSFIKAADGSQIVQELPAEARARISKAEGAAK